MSGIGTQVADVMVLLDPTDEELGRGPATITKQDELANSGWRSTYTGVVTVTPPMVGREVSRTRLITPLFTVTEPISKFRLTHAGDTVTVVQFVEITRPTPIMSSQGRRWPWNKA